MIAICGKGGVGKTTLAGLLARLRIDAPAGARTLVIDGDPAGGLGLALGLTPRATLDDLRREIIAQVQQSRPDGATLAAEADYRLLEILEERGPVAFLSVGRPEEEGCYCKLNTFLREAIESLCSRFDLVVVDAEAGIEQVNRRVMRSVDRLLLVSDLSVKGVRVAEAIGAVALEQGDKAIEVGLVINRMRPDAGARGGPDLPGAPSTHLPVVATLPEDPTISRHDALALPLWEIETCPTLEAVREQVLPWLAARYTGTR